MRDEGGQRPRAVGQDLGTDARGAGEQAGQVGDDNPEREPHGEREDRLRASRPRRAMRATQTPAIGPNSGPTPIAPMTQHGLVERHPDRGDEHREPLGKKAHRQLCGLRGPLSSTSSHTTASESRPAAAFSASRAASESAMSIISMGIERSCWMPSDVDHDRRALEELEGLVRAPLRRDDPEVDQGRAAGICLPTAWGAEAWGEATSRGGASVVVARAASAPGRAASGRPTEPSGSPA